MALGAIPTLTATPRSSERTRFVNGQTECKSQAGLHLGETLVRIQPGPWSGRIADNTPLSIYWPLGE